MINLVKEKIALFVVEKLLKQNSQREVTFTSFFTSSYTFFVVMPEDEKDFHLCFDFLLFLESQRKNIVVFTYDHKVSLLPIRFRHSVAVHGINDVTRWNLPTKNVQEKLSKLHFDVAIDLNRKENLYNSLALNLVKSNVKVGFRKEGSDRFYNVQVENDENDPAISYKNLLNCLNMF